MAKAEKDFLQKCRLEAGSDLTDAELDPEYSASRGPNRETGMNIRCQLFALSKDAETCCVGLFRYLSLGKPTEFTIAKSLTEMEKMKAFDTRLPVSIGSRKP